MKYKKFFFKNYKGINNLCFSINEGAANCIIGNNESGKTTILKGIDRIGELCDGNKLESVFLDGIDSIKPKGAYFNGTTIIGAILESSKNEFLENKSIIEDIDKDSIKLELELEFHYVFINASFNEEKTIIKINDRELKSENDKQDIHRLIRKCAHETIYYHSFQFSVPGHIEFQKTVNNNSNTNATINIDETYTKLPRTFDEMMDRLNKSWNEHWHKIFDDILKGSNKDAKSFQEDIVDWTSKESNSPTIAQDRLSGMEKYLNAVLKDWINNQNCNIEGFKIYETSSDNGVMKYMIRIIDNKGNQYEISERSTGFQWSFCFNIFTKVRKNRHGAGFIFLLDEPASNSHMSRQRGMLKDINDLIIGKDLVIYTTHCPELVTDELDNIFVSKNKAGELGVSNINLYSLESIKEQKIDISDIEPMLAKFAYSAIQQLSDKKDKKQMWREVTERLKTTVNKLLDSNKIQNFIRIRDFIYKYFESNQI